MCLCSVWTLILIVVFSLPLPVFTSCVVLVSRVFDYSSCLFLSVLKLFPSVVPVVVIVQNKYSTSLSLLDTTMTIWLAFDFKTFAVHFISVGYMVQQVFKNDATKVM